MNRLLTINQARIMAWSVDFSFLMIHVLLFLLFRANGVTPMMYFNVFSMAFYAVMPLFIYRKLFRFFCMATYFEVVLHMSLAAYFTGWENGFQVTLFGMCILLAYCEYAGRYLKVPYIRATLVSIAGMAAYILTCVLTQHHPAQYPLPENLTYFLNIAWAVITFSIMILFLFVFVQLSAGTEELLAHEVDHDQLTGLPNRYNLWDRLNKLDQTCGLEGHWAAMIDIDDFKNINDTYGHNCGDFILKEIANILSSNTFGMHACRWGGEEFLLTGETGGDFAASVKELDELRRVIERRTFFYEKEVLHVTITIGAAEYEAGTSARDWIGAADSLMYNGKRAGKNRVVA